MAGGVVPEPGTAVVEVAVTVVDVDVGDTVDVALDCDDVEAMA